MRYSLIVLWLLLVGVGSHAQELTGIWRGSFYNEYEYLFTGNKYRYEVQIKESNGGLKGVTYSYQNTRFYGKAGAVGKWTSSTKNVILKENKMMDLKITGGGDGCLMTCYLEYRKEGEREFLVGTYTSVNMNNDSISCGGGVVRLEKVPDSDFEKEDFLKETTKTPPPSGKTKPGQEEFLVKKPTTTQKPAAAKPNSSAANPTKPKASTQPPVAKTNPPAAKPPATKPQVNGKKPPANTQQQSVAKSGTTNTAAKPPVPKPANPQPPKQTAKVTPPAPVKSSGDLKNTTSADKPADKEVVNTKPAEKSTAKPVPPPAVLKTRTNELVETVDVASRNVMVSFYDNGEVDGDTISVYYNNRLLAARKGLNAQGFQIELKLDENVADHELVMVAENLGAIPPNTALMIVVAGNQRYTLRMSSTEQKNAMVRFRYTGATP